MRRLFVLLVAAAAAACSDVPEREAEIDLTIGTDSGSGPDRFGEIAGLALDDADRIWVADAFQGEVRVFTSDGTFAFALTGTGQAGDRFSVPCCITFDDEGRLWIRDTGHSRYVVFRPSESGAQFLFVVPTRTGVQSLGYPTTFDEQGRLIDIRRLERGSGGGASRFVLDTAGVVLDSLFLSPVPQESLGVMALQSAGAVWFVKPPFGAQELIAHGPRGDYARAVSSRYLVERYDASGQLLHTIERLDERGPPLRPQQRALAEGQLIEDANRMGAAPAELAGLLPFRNQVIAGLYFDRQGQLWVERHVQPDRPRVADVFDRQGNQVFRIEFPAEANLAEYNWIENDRALAVRVDTVPGLERLVRLRIR